MSKVINIQELKDTTLYRELISRDDNDFKPLISNLTTICDEAAERSKLIPSFFWEYTLHDKTHFIRVTELMSYVLGNTLKELNDLEIILLILSAFLHDQGMVIDESEYSLLEKEEDFILFRENWYLAHPNYSEILKQLNIGHISDKEKITLTRKISELDCAMLTDYLRDSHGERVYKYIIKTFSTDKRLYIFGISLAEYIAEVCLSHTKSVEWIVGNNKLLLDDNIGRLTINTRFISFVLRLADILDFDSDRTPDVLFNSIHFTNQISINEWQKHRGIKGWKFSEKTIQFTMKFDHPVYEKTARIFLDWIDEELEEVHLEIRKFPAEFVNYKISLANKVDRSRIGAKNNSYLFHDLEFSLSRNEIVKLLMTDNLYGNSSLFLRELLQNSLDALRLRKAIFKKDGLDWVDGKVKFRHYLDENDQEIVECHDNGCGMDEVIISKFLGKVGRSYYRSPEFEQLRLKLKEGNTDFEPCSQFGIGFMSLFMVGDRIVIQTRKDYGMGKAHGKPLIIEINGLGGLMVVKEGDNNQEIGTTIKVYTREKPLLYDEWRDSIRLLLTLKGYAVMTEFPIDASCEIKEIEACFSIPVEVDKKKTFLEKINIKNIRTIEIDFSDINKNIRGFIRQSFLIDDEGNYCLENNEAKWGRESRYKVNLKDEFEVAIFSKKDNKNIKYDKYHGHDGGHSVCIDGILICGYPGRAEYSRLEMFRLGHINPQINIEHPFTIDIRGDIKPEITPARRPSDNRGQIDHRPGWSKIHDLVNKAGGKIWQNLLISLHNSNSSMSVFWNLLFIYGGAYNSSISDIPLNILLKYLQLPIKDRDWLKLSSINSFRYNEEEIIVTVADNDFQVCFSDEIKKWVECEKNPWNIQNFLIGILKSVSELRFDIQNEPIYYIRSFIDDVKTQSDHSLYWGKTIPFIGVDESYITSASDSYIYNSLNHLVNTALICKYSKHENEIQAFSKSLISRINHYISDCRKDKKNVEVNNISGVLRYEAALYCSIDWSKYSSNLKPPYRIYVDRDTTIEITDSMLREWHNPK